MPFQIAPIEVSQLTFGVLSLAALVLFGLYMFRYFARQIERVWDAYKSTVDEHIKENTEAQKDLRNTINEMYKYLSKRNGD